MADIKHEAATRLAAQGHGTFTTTTGTTVFAGLLPSEKPDSCIAVFAEPGGTPVFRSGDIVHTVEGLFFQVRGPRDQSTQTEDRAKSVHNDWKFSGNFDQNGSRWLKTESVQEPLLTFDGQNRPLMELRYEAWRYPSTS